MPKDTFHNLGEEKKQRIFNAAVREFSKRRFSEASLNRIVKAAGIPWGSFYQYFTGKEDIFRYMFEEILREKMEVLKGSADVDLDADIFEVCIQTTRASYEWSKVRPDYSQVGLLMEADNSEFIAGLRAAAGEKLRGLVERDKERGLIKREIDSALIVDIIYTLIMKEYFWVGLDERAYLKRVGDVMKIIREGIAVGVKP